MHTFEVFRVALAALLTSKVRAFLTMLGIIIGVGSVIAMMAMGEGAKASVKDKIAEMIDSHLTVRGGAGNYMIGLEMLTLDDYAAVRREARYVRAAVPASQGWSAKPIKYRNKTAPAPVTPATPDYSDRIGPRAAPGPLLTDADGRNPRRACGHGPDLARALR